MGNTYQKMNPPPTPDLPLPSHCPGPGIYGNTNWDNASLALYTLIDLPHTELQTIATTLEERWMQVSDYSNPILSVSSIPTTSPTKPYKTSSPPKSPWTRR